MSNSSNLVDTILAEMANLNSSGCVTVHLQKRCEELQATIERETCISETFNAEKLKLEAEMAAISSQIVKICDQHPEVYDEKIDEEIEDLRFSLSCAREQRAEASDCAEYAECLVMDAAEELEATKLSILLLSLPLH